MNKLVHVQSVLPLEDVIALKEKTGESSVKEAIFKAVYHYLKCNLRTYNRARILRDDLFGRFKAGEVGEVLPNDFPDKYDYKLKLSGTDHVENLFSSGPVEAIRIYYFYAYEVEPIEDDIEEE